MWKVDKLLRTVTRQTKTEQNLFANGDSFNGAYLTDDAAGQFKSLLIDIINTKAQDIAKERRLFSETVSGTSFNTNTFLHYVGMKGVKAVDGDYKYSIAFTVNNDGTITCPYHDSDNKEAEYYYYPDDIADENSDFPIPENKINPIMFCYWASFIYFQERKKYDKAAYWLSLYQSEESKRLGEIDNQVKQGW